MLASVALTIAAAFTGFHAHLAFTYPAGAFGTGFIGGLGSGLIIAIYDYLGYYTAAEMGDELANPGRVTFASVFAACSGVRDCRFTPLASGCSSASSGGSTRATGSRMWRCW